MTARRTILSDAAVRTALTQEPPRDAASLVWGEVEAAIAETPQRRRPLVAWPWSPSLPGVPVSYRRRRVQRLAVLVLVALMVASSVAVVGLIGSLRRLPPTLGLARPGLIAYDSGGDIFVSNADGSGRNRLTAGSASDIQPLFSPEGTRIAYLSLLEANAMVEVGVMNTDGTDRMTVGTTPAIVEVGGTVSIGWWRVSWSPDGRHLAYTGIVNGRPQIFVASMDGAGAVLVGDPSLEGQDPVWSPDGARIAFRGGRYDVDRGIYVMDADGSNIQRMTGTDGSAVGNTYSFFAHLWSPNGGSIAYTNWISPTAQQVRVVDVADRVDRPISNATEYDDFPAWSPDGSRLAYFTSAIARFGPARPAHVPREFGLAPTTTHGHAVVVRSDGTGEVRLSASVGGPPAWSPDGNGLVAKWYDDGVPYQDSIVIIDIEDDTHTVLPARGSTPADQTGVQGLPTWQRLAD